MGAIADPKGLRQAIKDMTPAQALAKMTKDGRALCSRIKKRRDACRASELEFYWESGHDLVVAIRESQSRTKAKKYCEYGTYLLELAAAAVGFKSPSPLRNAVRVVRQWPDKAKFMQLANACGDSGNQLSAKHFITIASVGSPELREQLAMRALSDNWTAETLAVWIRNKYPACVPVGRTPSPPKSITGCLSQMYQQARSFNNRAMNAWTGDAFDLAAQAEALPEDHVDEALLRTFDTAYDSLLDMAKHAESCCDLIDAVRSSLQERMQAAGTAKEEEDEEAYCVNLAAKRNAEARAKRAKAKAKKEAAAKRKAAKAKGKAVKAKSKPAKAKKRKRVGTARK